MPTTFPERALHNQRVGPMDAFDLAKRQFMRGERIAMRSLADELGVDRSTLHRWVGNRGKLLGEIAWYLIDRSFEHALGRVDDHADSRVGAALSTLIADVHRSGTMSPAVTNEGLAMLQRVTDDDGPVRPRLRTTIADQLAREHVGHDRGELDEIADLVTRVVESYLWVASLHTQPPARSAVDRSLRRALAPLQGGQQ